MAEIYVNRSWSGATRTAKSCAKRLVQRRIIQRTLSYNTPIGVLSNVWIIAHIRHREKRGHSFAMAASFVNGLPLALSHAGL